MSFERCNKCGHLLIWHANLPHNSPIKTTDGMDDLTHKFDYVDHHSSLSNRRHKPSCCLKCREAGEVCNVRGGIRGRM